MGKLNEVDDRQLVNQFLKNRSEKAFRKLYRAKTPHLYQMALRLTYDNHQSEELIQEMWIVAVRKLEGFEWKSELKTWLTSILINLFRSSRKQSSKEVIYNSTEVDPERAGQQEHLEEVEELEVAIRDLPPGSKEVLVLHDIEGYKHKEIAEMLEISEGTSKSQLHQARKALRARLKEFEV